MLTPNDEIIRYDGRTLTVLICPTVQVEARRGRRWRWLGQKGWWVQLYFFQGWKSKKFVLKLSEAGIFLKHDPDYLPWITDSQQRQATSASGQKSSSSSSLWMSGGGTIPFLLL
jgi:hypothetical protein